MPSAPSLTGLPGPHLDPEPVRCIHVLNAQRPRPHTMLSGGRVWNLCDACHERLMDEWTAVAEEKRAEWIHIRAATGERA